MKRVLPLLAIAAALSAATGIAQPGVQPAADPVVDGFRMVEVASVSDAMEQLYGQRAYMSHEMRPLSTTKFAAATHCMPSRAIASGTSRPDNTAGSAVYEMCSRAAARQTARWAWP